MQNSYLLIHPNKKCTVEKAETLTNLIARIDEEYDPHFATIFHIDTYSNTLEKIDVEEVSLCIAEIYDYKEIVNETNS